MSYDPNECYCGPKAFPRWVRCLLSQQINWSCYNHDVAYGAGGSRRRADRAFKHNIEAELADRSWWTRLYGKAFIVPMVRGFGWMFKKPR